MFRNYKQTFFSTDIRTLIYKLEAKSESLIVFWADKFKLKLTSFLIQVKASKSKKFNVLEEFILKACVELQQRISIEEIAEIFGLDKIFIIETVKGLIELKAVKVISNEEYDFENKPIISGDTVISITENGKIFYKEGCVPAPPRIFNVYGYINPFDGYFYFSDINLFKESNENQSKDIFNSLNGINPVAVDLINFDNEKWLDVFKQHNFEKLLKENERVIDVNILAIDENFSEIILLFLYDKIEKEIKVKAKLALQENFNENISNILTKYIIENLDENGIIDFFQIRQNVEKYYSLKLQKDSLEKLVNEIDLNTRSDLISYYDYQKMFFEILENAKKYILIYLPVLDIAILDEINMHSKKAKVLIGYGKISEDLDFDFNELYKDILIIKLDEEYGLKELISDDKTYIFEFLDWVYYKDKTIPFGENVIKTTNENIVSKRVKFWKRKYFDFANILFEKYKIGNDIEAANLYIKIMFYFDELEKILENMLEIEFEKADEYFNLIINALNFDKQIHEKITYNLAKLKGKYENDEKFNELILKFEKIKNID